LRSQWEAGLAAMRDRIKDMRAALGAALDRAGFAGSTGFATDQVGMFSYTGLTTEQMVRLRTEYGVYGTDKGRICIAALNPGNVDYVAQAMAAVS
jgi:aromatic-amino-acid transaminase